MRFGRIAETTRWFNEGFLPIFSVDTEDEARELLALTCPRNLDGEYVAPELAEEQTLDKLYSFGDRLRRAYEGMKERAKVRWRTHCRDCGSKLAADEAMWCTSCSRRRRV